MKNIMNTKQIIEYWYEKLNFPKKYNEEFYRILNDVEIPSCLSLKDYEDGKDGQKDLLAFLYFCENVKKKYEEKGIPPEILYDTLSDIIVWTEVWSRQKGKLFLGETPWLKNYHFEMRLFKLGRLQFCMGEAPYDIPKKELLRGDPIIEMHIPSTGSLKNELCVEAVKKAGEFFKKFYPEYEYKFFTCDSWLLDLTLGEFLDEKSNIIKFQNMFDIVHKEKSDKTLKYVFDWSATRENLSQFPCNTELAKKVKAHALSGKDFYRTYGILKENFV